MDNNNNRKKIPVVLTAFGTTAKAFSTYEKMDSMFKKELPDHHIIWAYSSRMVKSALKKNKNFDLKDPAEMLAQLRQKGHQWAVLQSLHIIGGHELHRLAAQGNTVDIRLSLGLPLLSSPRDFKEVSQALAPVIPGDPEEAVVIIGHGTDHPSWTSYFALETILRKQYGFRLFTGVVEGFPEMKDTIQRVIDNGFKKVRLIPFMLVAGVHFLEDLTEEEDSWQKTFESKGIKVSVLPHGLGELDGISKVYSRHIKEALDVIPL